MNRKMAAELAKVIYSKHKSIVEPCCNFSAPLCHYRSYALRGNEKGVNNYAVFGQIKNSGFRGFSARGKEKDAGEFSMVSAAHNFKKIAKAIVMG